MLLALLFPVLSAVYVTAMGPPGTPDSSSSDGEEKIVRVIVTSLAKCEDDPGVVETITLKRRGLVSILKVKVALPEDIGDAATLTVKLYESGSMGMKNNILTLKYTGCENWKIDNTFFGPILEGGDFPAECPVPKGTYSATNAVYNITVPYKGTIPPGSYSAVVNLDNAASSIVCIEGTFDLMDEK